MKNKGFSLVELIIVIAIMAILVGVMAPQLIKYIEKSKVSSDVQVCDTVRTAYVTALSDPDVVNASSFAVPTSLTEPIATTNPVGSCVVDILGTSSPSTQLKSTTRGTNSLKLSVTNGNQVTVWVCTGIGAGPGKGSQY